MTTLHWDVYSGRSDNEEAGHVFVLCANCFLDISNDRNMSEFVGVTI